MRGTKLNLNPVQQTTANALARLTPACGPLPRIPGFGGCAGGFWGGVAAAARPRSGREPPQNSFIFRAGKARRLEISKTQPQSKGSKADYAKSISLVPELTEISNVHSFPICGLNECVE